MELFFTCLTTRAVHLELASELSRDVFISALRCFIAHHGKPKEILCDNSTNFIGTDQELSKSLQDLNQSKIVYCKWFIHRHVYINFKKFHCSGKPKEILCNNATNFTGADQELSKALQDLNQSKIVTCKWFIHRHIYINFKTFHCLLW